MTRVRTVLLVFAAVLLIPAAHALPAGDTDEAFDGVPGTDTVKMPADASETVKDPEGTVQDLLKDDPDKSEPEEGEGSGGWWNWDDVARVGQDIGSALASEWGLVAVAVAGLGAGGAYVFGGVRLQSPEEVLENDLRRNIFEYVKETTGAHLHQISEDLDLSTTNAVWHLRKLEDAGLVQSKKFNGYRIFYPVEGGVEAKKLSIGVSVLNNDNARRIFRHVVDNPGHHQRKMARSLDINHGTVRWHLRKMRKAEMVLETKKGNTTKYFPTDLGRKALGEMTGTTLGTVETPDPSAVPGA